MPIAMITKLIDNIKFSVQSLTALTAQLMLRGTAVERQSLAGELSLSCARPVADG